MHMIAARKRSDICLFERRARHFLAWGFLLLAASGDVLASEPSEELVTSESPVSHDFLRPITSEHQLLREVSLFAAENARFVAGQTTSLLLGRKGASVPAQRVSVKSGRVDVLIKKRAELRGVLLTAPGKVAGISKGGRLGMFVGDDEIVVGALVGDAVVGKSGKYRPLKEGNLRIFNRKKGTSRVVAIPPAPSLEAQDGLRLALRGNVRAHVKSLDKAPLRLVVLNVEGKRVAEVESSEARGVEFSLPGAGVYTVYARQLGPGRMGGPLSVPLKFQYLGLSAGQRGPVDGIFLLDRGERVSLLGTEGLELRYDSSPQFVPAFPSIGLSRNQLSRVEFRDPQKPEKTITLKLAPRVMESDIVFDSPNATWPGKSVGVRVAIKDGRGKLITLKHRMKIVTQVNMKKVSPKWTMTKKGLFARIASPKGKGPWVIRVNLVDRNGRSLARKHLEVASR